MHILISSEGDLSLGEAHAFNGFSIVEVASIKPQGAANISLEKIATADEDNHYWLDIDAVIALYTGDDPSKWLVKFWAMLDSAEPYGYLDRANNRVKAHLETQSK
ncbi:MAG: hypothetical protein ACJAVV_003042 [Alphaproteobacteria bacterium]|jgi:hypothetical protein